MKRIVIALFLIIPTAGGVWWWFGPLDTKDQPGVFVVKDQVEGRDLATRLGDEQYIRSSDGFRLLFTLFAKGKMVAPGGYRLNKNMNAWQVLRKISEKPDFFWVTLSGCLRKEQVGEILAAYLGWDTQELKDWNGIYKEFKPEYIEGVYFPDTYLLPADEPVGTIAKRFFDNFNEKFAPLAEAAVQKNIKWTTLLKIASLIEREAAGPQDILLISGIIWNRLDKGMRLEIDATLQYIQGKTDNEWWSQVVISDKEVNSPYNTYLYKGLPPYPICNPGLAAIDAALNPEDTDCLYYLHDHNRQIHCSITYEGHKENIRKFL